MSSWKKILPHRRFRAGPGKKRNTTSNRKPSPVLAGKLDLLEQRLSGLAAKAIFDKEQWE